MALLPSPALVGPGPSTGAAATNLDLELLGLAPGDRLADVGCGEGRMAEVLASAGIHVTGIEPAAYLRERFMSRVTVVDPESTAVEGRADRLPFSDGALRCIVMTEVLEHVPDPESALRELRRVLAPNGTLCLSVPTSFTELAFWRLHPRYADNATHERIFTKPELRRLIRRCGFEIVRWEGRNFRPAVSWLFHSLLRSRADHTGAILEHHFVDLALGGVWRLLRLLGAVDWVEAVGNRIWPKSWYVYCRAD